MKRRVQVWTPSKEYVTPPKLPEADPGFASCDLIEEDAQAAIHDAVEKSFGPGRDPKRRSFPALNDAQRDQLTLYLFAAATLGRLCLRHGLQGYGDAFQQGARLVADVKGSLAAVGVSASPWSTDGTGSESALYTITRPVLRAAGLKVPRCLDELEVASRNWSIG